MNSLTRAAGLVVALLTAGCARPSAEVTAAAVERGMYAYPEGERDGLIVRVTARDVRERGDGGCELVAHAGRCELTGVTVERDANGEREVVAVYRALDERGEARAERRYRVSYLARSEEEQVALVRQRAVLGCRWQTVTRGACEAYPAEVDAPDVERSADARHRDGSHRHGRHREHHKPRSHGSHGSHHSHRGDRAAQVTLSGT